MPHVVAPQPDSAYPAEPPDDLLCALCHSLYHEPLVTPCRHTFCAFCLGRLFDTRRPIDGNASPSLELRQHAERAFPALYAQRSQEIQEEQDRQAARRLQVCRLHVGNFHSTVPPRAGSTNQHDWTFFVRMESVEDERRFIDHVTVLLHPTFRPSALVLREPPFAVRRLGWGYFVIWSAVTFRPEWSGETIVVPWQLDFDGEGAMQAVEVELERTPPASAAGQQALQQAVSQPSAHGSAAAEEGWAQEEDWRQSSEEEGSSDTDDLRRGAGGLGSQRSTDASEDEPSHEAQEEFPSD